MLLISDDLDVESSVTASLVAANRKADLVGACELSCDDGFAKTYEVALLDLEFPIAFGNELLGRLRRRNPRLSTIVLAREALRRFDFALLDVGERGYVAYSVGQALTCLRAILDKDARRSSGILTNGALKLDTQTREASFLSEKALLDRSEANLLGALLAHPGRVFRKADLEVRLNDRSADNRSLDSVVHAIRGKLGMLAIRWVDDLGWMVAVPPIERAIEAGFFDECQPSQAGNIILFPGAVGRDGRFP